MKLPAKARFLDLVCALGCGSLAIAQEASPPPLSPELLEKYAAFMGETKARQYLEGLDFYVGETSEAAVELRVHDHLHRVVLLSLSDADDCEACRGQVDALVFQDGKPLFVHPGFFRDGSHGHPHMGGEPRVVPLAAGMDGLLLQGELWLPRGCSAFHATLFAMAEAPDRELRTIFQQVLEGCENDSVQIKGLRLESKGLDPQGRGRFLLTTVKLSGGRKVGTSKDLRFDPSGGALVAATAK